MEGAEEPGHDPELDTAIALRDAREAAIKKAEEFIDNHFWYIADRDEMRWTRFYGGAVAKFRAQVRTSGDGVGRFDLEFYLAFVNVPHGGVPCISIARIRTEAVLR